MTGEPALAGNHAAGVANAVSGGTWCGPVLQGRAFSDVDIDVTVRPRRRRRWRWGTCPRRPQGPPADELAVLAGLLDPAGTGGPAAVSAVAGLARVGKTTLAIQAGHAAVQAGWFTGGVLFVDLHGYDQPVEPGQALDGLLRALGAARRAHTARHRASYWVGETRQWGAAPGWGGGRRAPIT